MEEYAEEMNGLSKQKSIMVDNFRSGIKHWAKRHCPVVCNIQQSVAAGTGNRGTLYRQRGSAS